LPSTNQQGVDCDSVSRTNHFASQERISALLEHAVRVSGVACSSASSPNESQLAVSELLLESRPLTLQDFCEVRERLAPAIDGRTLVAQLLEEQQQLTAVERFAMDHDPRRPPDQARYYSKLLPAGQPAPGQQYAFEVDLDRCSGCKACVTGCHALNGLDRNETWRDVGLLVGGTESHPVMQHVTAACHHCLDPGCMNACPVDAYEKDPVTGIVRHLDDQCFGCQYCTLACPYDVPKYHKEKGIVRKCDMCSGRLARGEAPACVQACPHEAIAIRIVDVAQVMENAEINDFLPAAPEPHLTLPTTTYKSSRNFPRNMLPADYYSISPQHPHWPLIIMLVLTQLSVGAFLTGCVMERSLDSRLVPVFRPFHATAALLLGLLALGASTLHLGRPQYAFRGMIGLRHSWLSREILTFGLFAGLAIPFAAVSWGISLVQAPFPGRAFLLQLLPGLGLAVGLMGGVGVFCSAMIYVYTKKELWSFGRTVTRFGLTSAILGIATVWLSLSVTARFVDAETGHRLSAKMARPLAESLMIVSAAKLVFDAWLLHHLFNFRNTPLKRSALLVTGVLSRISLSRVIAGALGGILIPALVLSRLTNSPQAGGAELSSILAIWIFSLIAELCERYLFFAAVSAPRMPGGIRS
jgi:Fe-S-cluster-containing dehydrogenase component/DMSO reductase anchor subunit